MKLETKFIVPVLITALVGCATDHEASSEQTELKKSTNQTETRIQPDKLSTIPEREEVDSTYDTYSPTQVGSLASGMVNKHKAERQAHESAYAQSFVYVPHDQPVPYYQDSDREKYASITQNAVKQVAAEPHRCGYRKLQQYPPPAQPGHSATG